MLKHLKVANLAVVENLEADFSLGLNVLTGETGAGKSVLIGALELALGARAEAGVVRDGAKEACIEAEFLFPLKSAKGSRGAREDATYSKLAAILEESGIISSEEDGGEEFRSLIIRRTIGAKGGVSRVWVNDCASTVATLRKIGREIADVHGPRANQAILEEKFQREALDSFGDIEKTAYSGAWAALSATREKIKILEEAENVEEEVDLLKYQSAEIEEAAITEEDDTLAERHAAQAHAGEIVEAANQVTELLGGDEGIEILASRIQSRLNSIERFFPEAENWKDEANNIAIASAELSRSIADAASRLDVDPDELERMDARLAVINRLKRKYLGSQIDFEDEAFSAKMQALLERKKARLEELSSRTERLALLRAEEEREIEAVRSEGEKLRRARQKAAKNLASLVTGNLKDLGFNQSKFDVETEKAEPSSSGCDRIVYMFEPNPGQSARSLADIASSGEIARVMLALKATLAEHDATPILVFDEIDANIGGETGRAVGAKMREVAAGRQVIAITHLPQSAIYASHHLVISKSVEGGKTRTKAVSAEGEDRLEEIKRMLGGGKAAYEHAKALLESAKAPKQKQKFSKR